MGTTLSIGEDDYADGICLHLDDPDTVFIAANVNPVTGKLPGCFEIYRGHTRNQGATWTYLILPRIRVPSLISPARRCAD